jgi:hypothetical protein
MGKRSLEPYFKLCPGGGRLNAKLLCGLGLRYYDNWAGIVTLVGQDIGASDYSLTFYSNHTNEITGSYCLGTDELIPRDFAKGVRDELGARVKALVLDNCIIPGDGEAMAGVLGANSCVIVQLNKSGYASTTNRLDLRSLWEPVPGGTRPSDFRGALSGLLTRSLVHARVALRRSEPSLDEWVAEARKFSAARQAKWLGFLREVLKSIEDCSESAAWKAVRREKVEGLISQWTDAGIPTLIEGDLARRAGPTPVSKFLGHPDLGELVELRYGDNANLLSDELPPVNLKEVGLVPALEALDSVEQPGPRREPPAGDEEEEEEEDELERAEQAKVDRVFNAVLATRDRAGLDVHSLTTIRSVAGALPWTEVGPLLKAADAQWNFTRDCQGVGVYLRGMAALAGGAQRVIAALVPLEGVAAVPGVG